MINTERVKLVVDALRGDEYEQGTHALVNVDGGDREYCCLGVMCDIALKNGISGLAERDGESQIGYVTNGDFTHAEYSLLPLAVMQWYGFDSVGPAVNVPGNEGLYSEELAVLNDSGWSFSDIADVIESTYLTPEV